jgi:GxxExxY protein
MSHDHVSPAAQRIRLLHEELTGQILGAFYSVYRELGGGFVEPVYERALAKELTRLNLRVDCQVPRELGGGFVEPVYERALAKELTRLNLRVDCQVPITVNYKHRPVGLFRADILVNEAVLLELKARPTIEPTHESQLLNCLRATPIEVGLLLNFGPQPQFKRLVFSNKGKKARRSQGH